MIRYAPQFRIVLAHLFSILPKLGLDEATVTDEAISRLLSAAHRTEAAIEVSERWRCPSERVVQMAAARHVRLVASTDSHRAVDVGRYSYVANDFGEPEWRSPVCRLTLAASTLPLGSLGRCWGWRWRGETTARQ